jgi:redox-sensitive bicupin YhaK (pirin superfamily)
LWPLEAQEVVMKERTIQEIRRAHPSRDGDGVAIQRIAAMQHAGMDPILMIDELRSEQREDFAGGFPPHPHRGMQTLTYMKRGGIIHQDSAGNRGEVRDGGAQWMSAGRGIIHSEMPTADSTGFHGFQVWINLPAAAKMSAPRYRDVPRTQLSEVAGEGYLGAAISGAWSLAAPSGVSQTAAGPLVELAERAALLDLELAPGAAVELSTAATESALAYIYAGGVVNADTLVRAQHLLVSARGESWRLQAGPAGASVLLLRGEPLGEPVAHYGPFVMNTAAEIEQTLRDYQSGDFL